MVRPTVHYMSNSTHMASMSCDESCTGSILYISQYAMETVTRGGFIKSHTAK